MASSPSPAPSHGDVPTEGEATASALGQASATDGALTGQGEGAASAIPVPLKENRDYRLLLTGSTVAELGNGMMSLAFMLLTVAMTGSAGMAGLVSGAYLAGLWIMTLPAGALVDRWNRKRVMVGTSLAGALTMASVPVAEVAGVLSVPQLMIVAAVIGGLSCFYSPAESAALKKIVPSEQMGHALSLNQARMSLGMVVGSPAAAALFGVWRVLPQAINMVCYTVGALCAGLVRADLPAPTREKVRLRSLVDDVVIGMRWVWKARAVRDMVMAGMVINLGLNGMFSTGVLSLQLHGVKASTLGWMDAVVGAAGIVAALVTPRLLRLTRIGIIAVSSMFVLTASSWLMPVHLSVWWIGGTLVLAELALAPLNAGIGAYRVHVTPDAMQGRSLAAARFVSMAMMPISTTGAGFLLDHAGRVPAMIVFALVFTAGAVGCVASKPIRSMPHSRDLAEVPEITL